MDGWNYEWMICLNVNHPSSDIKCGKANWEKLVVEPHEMSMEVDEWILWNWWNIVYMEEGMELMKKCSCKWGWMKCFGTNEMFINYKWMNEKMHGWMDGLIMIWIKKLI